MKIISFLLVLFLINIFEINGQLTLNSTNITDEYEIKFQYLDQYGSSVFGNLSPTTRVFSENNNGYLIWYEYGDGKFTFQPKFKHSYSTSNINSPLLKITGIYEGGNKPVRPTRVLLSNSFPITNNPSINSNFEANDLLNSGYNVKITPSINAVKNNDTIHFAIDYKVPTKNGVWKLVFEYNIGTTCFYYTSLNQTIKDSYDPRIQTGFIRTHNGENAVPHNNKIEFLGLTNDPKPKTVFVTLLSNYNANVLGNNTNFKAYLINEDEKQRPDNIENSNKDVQSLRNIGDRPYDPNFLEVEKCILKPTKTKELHYHLHFQNTGTGPSNDSVRIAIKLPNPPQGFTNSQVIANAVVTSMNFANQPITALIPFNSRVLNSYNTPNALYYDFQRTDSIILNYVKTTYVSRQGPNTILEGLNILQPNFMNDKKTMGDIYFTLKLLNYKKRTDLKAQASIVFDTEEPVLTDPTKTKVRRRCKERNSADCNCKKNKKTFAQWIREKCD